MKKLMQGVIMTIICAVPALASGGLRCVSYTHAAHQGDKAYLRMQTVSGARVEVVDGNNGSGHRMFRTAFADKSGNVGVDWKVGQTANPGFHTVTAYAYRVHGNVGARLGPLTIRYQVLPK